MAGLYANQSLQGALDKLGPVERSPKIGQVDAETVITLAIATAPFGQVQCIMCLDVVVGLVHTVMSTPLCAYPVSMQDLAYADATMVSMKLGLQVRRAEVGKGWTYCGGNQKPMIVSNCDDRK